MAKWTAVEQSQNLYQCTVTIAATASESEAFNLGGRALCLVVYPSGWDPASVGLKVSMTKAGTYTGILRNQAGDFLLMEAGADYPIVLPQGDDHVWGPWAKLVSCDSAGAAVVQSADRVITLYSRTMHQ